MTPPTLAEVAELIELERKATPGPWQADSVWLEEGGCCGRGPECVSEDNDGAEEDQAECDGAPIAALRNAAPALLAAAKRLAELPALSEALEYIEAKGQCMLFVDEMSRNLSEGSIIEIATELGWTPPSEAK